MAHITSVDGTAYEISGGKTSVDGTAYSIKSGKTSVDGTAYSFAFGAAIIEFKIDSQTYQAEDGMTWAEWCNSTYNTGGYFISGSSVYDQSGFLYIMGQTPTTVIVADSEHITVMDF